MTVDRVVTETIKRKARALRRAGRWLAGPRLAIGLAAGLAAGLAVGLPAQRASAASQGNLAATSQGTITVGLQATGMVRISKLDDINLGTWTGGDLAGNDRLCAFSSTWGYRLTATSANASGTAFRLSNGGGTFIAYGVQWRDSFNRLFTLQNGANSPRLWGIAFSTTCTVVGTNAQVLVNVPSANIAGKPAGTYSDTLTLVIAPQ